VLSLPFAIQKAGIALGLVYLFGAGALSAFSIRLLLSSSRRSGAQSYQDVALKAFGKKMKYFTMFLLVSLTFLASVAYLVLARDLAVPVVESYITETKLSKMQGNWVSVICLSPVIPLCFAKSLHSLRFTSLSSLFALSLLSGIIIYRCIQRAGERPIKLSEVKWASTDISESLYAIPFMQLSFMCHFNVLPVHTGLRKPTRRRLDHVVFFTIFVAIIFYTAVALSGYLYAFDHKCDEHSSSTCSDYVSDNILNVFDLKDGLVDTGRIGFLCALMFSFPLLVLPCRDTLLMLINDMTHDNHLERPPRRLSDLVEDQVVVSDTNYVALGDQLDRDCFEDEESATASFSNDVYETPGGEVLSIIDSSDSPEFRTPHIRRQQRKLRLNLMAPFRCCSSEGFKHILSTIVLLVLAVLIMFIVPGVAVVWNITGSTVGMLLGFILPATFYIKIRSPDGIFHPHSTDLRFCMAWGLLIFSTTMGIICTMESVRSAFATKTK